MIYLRELAIDTFILLRAHWTVVKALQLITRSKATHVIVHRSEPDMYQYLTQQHQGAGTGGHPSEEVKDYYYLYTLEEGLALLEEADIETPLRYALGLHEYEATPVSEAYLDAELAPDRSIIMDERRIIGFVDAKVPPTQVRIRGLTRSSPIESTVIGGGGRDLNVAVAYPTRSNTFELEATEAVPRSLRAEFPDRVPLQQTVSLLVSLLSELEGGVAAMGQLPLAVPMGTKLDIIIQQRRGFVVEGSSEASIVVSDEEEMVQFELKAVELGPGEIRVLAFMGGQRLGTITLKPMVVESFQPVSTERVVQEQGVVAVTVHDPDLYLLILEDKSPGKPTLTFRLKALDPGLGLRFQTFGAVTLQVDGQEYFNQLFKDIEDLPVQTAHDKAIAQKKLANKGALLFQQVIPQELQVLLWSLRNRIQTVQIQSVEPWIPWELCKLQGKENGKIVEGPFFCEAFAMTRCLDGIASKPTLNLKKMALVIPKDSGLPYAASERDYMLSLANGDRIVERIPANFLDVTEALGKGEYGGWHFTGHGGFRGPDPNRSVMLLESREEMSPEDLSGETSNLGLSGPLIFLNACQIGRSGMSLTDIGGWASQFMRAGAGGFIGAYWSIYDKAANDFTQVFYSKLLSGMEIGRAVKETRLAIKPLGDPTWLAYTVFADPLAKVVE